MDWALVLSCLAVASASAYLLLTFWNTYRMLCRGEVGLKPFFPYLSTAASCTLWFTYGILNNRPQLVVVHSIGLPLAAYSVGAYFNASSKESRPRLSLMILGAVIYLSFLFAITFTFAERGTAITIIGVAASVTFVAMSGSGLLGIPVLIKTRDISSMSWQANLAVVNLCSLWVAWSLLVRDIYVGITNSIGLLVAALQLGFVFWCRFVGAPKKVLSQILEVEEAFRGTASGDREMVVEATSRAASLGREC